MDVEAMEVDKFQKYKSDWTYPLYIRRAYLAGPHKRRRVTFQDAMKVTIITGQCFGLMPVLNVCDKDASKLRFTFKSWRCAYAIITIIFLIGLVIMCILDSFKGSNFSLGTNTSLIFHIMACATGIIFLHIAMKWPQLCRQISKTEASDPNMDYGLIRRCNFACTSILILALFEHSLSDMYGLTIAKDCDPQINLYESFVLHSFPWIFNYIPYNHFFGLISILCNVQCTFNWNFADVFVICMSLYLTSRLQQVNLRIVAVRGQYVPSSFWRTMREDYNRVSNLVKTVDDIIGGVVFISFANNLFFICLQLLHTLAEGFKETPRCRSEHSQEIDERLLGGYEQAVYFAYSFIFLMVRSLAVSLTASGVHTASKAPALSLYDVSSSTYCIEIQRFLEQIHGDTVALSGLQFFNVKRGLVLAIAGTIVTYELVLMQLSGISPTSATPV